MITPSNKRKFCCRTFCYHHVPVHLKEQTCLFPCLHHVHGHFTVSNLRQIFTSHISSSCKPEVTTACLIIFTFLPQNGQRAADRSLGDVKWRMTTQEEVSICSLAWLSGSSRRQSHNVSFILLQCCCCGARSLRPPRSPANTEPANARRRHTRIPSLSRHRCPPICHLVSVISVWLTHTNTHSGTYSRLQ